MANRRGKVEVVKYYILGGSKITTDGNYSHDIKRRLILGQKAMTKLDSVLKNKGIILPTKGHMVNAMVFPVVRYRCESLIKKSAEDWCFWIVMLGKTWNFLGLQDQTSQS